MFLSISDIISVCLHGLGDMYTGYKSRNVCWASPWCHHLCDTWTLQELTDSQPLLILLSHFISWRETFQMRQTTKYFLRDAHARLASRTSHSRRMGWNSQNQTSKFSVPLFLNSVSASKVELPKGCKWFRVARIGLQASGAVGAQYVGCDIRDQASLVLDGHGCAKWFGWGGRGKGLCILN